jgi:hypothetical protein
VSEHHGEVGIDDTPDDLRQWMTLDELREIHIIEHGFPGTEPSPLAPGEAESLALRMREILATAADRRKEGEPKLWHWEDYPADGPLLFG